MQQFVVWKLWRRVQADSVGDAPVAALPGENDEVRVIRNEGEPPPFAWLPYTKDELDALLACVSAAMPDYQQVLDVAQSDPVQHAARERFGILNSLRTSLAEARWGLMTPEQIEEERRDLQEAVDAGLIAGDDLA